MKLIILGGGFGGLKLARLLNNKTDFEITLIDKYNYHQFQPLFYQVATAGLDASNISFPLRKVFQNSKNIRFRMDEILSINTTQSQVITNNDTYDYDYLVIATGASTNFFGNKNLEEHTFPMKSTIEALQLRYRLIRNFEKALHADTEDDLQYLMNVVIVGGGPTGVELSGAIAEMKKYVLPKDYPELDFNKMNIYLLEGSPHTLAAMSKKSSEQSLSYLEHLGVTVMTNSHLNDYDGRTLTLKNGMQLQSALVIWAAGIKGNVPEGIYPALLARGNRIRVDKYNRVEGLNNVFAIGDIAYMEDSAFPHGLPQIASVAIQQSTLLAKNLKRTFLKESLKPFSYKDKGVMATVGRNLAVVDIPKPKLHFGGFFAWLVWMGLHLMLILGVKNKFFVFINWLYNYFTYDQSLRLIFKEDDNFEKK
jgi:NADH:ubiquinone reductase (H+-translocating)